jgi:hypothetical protein
VGPPDIGYKTMCRIGYGTEKGNFTNMICTHLHHRHLEAGIDGKNGERYPNVIVEVTLRRIRPKFFA